jgi:hypothetical protein
MFSMGTDAEMLVYYVRSGQSKSLQKGYGAYGHRLKKHFDSKQR